MKKIVNLNKTVYDLVQEFPEAKDILASLGFSKITSPMALKVMGRVMTIPKGAAMMGIPMETIVRAFASHGLTVKDAPPATESEQQAEIQSHAEKSNSFSNDLDPVKISNPYEKTLFQTLARYRHTTS